MSIAVKRGKRRGDPGLWSGALDVGKALLTGGPGAGVYQLGTELGLWGGPTTALPQINVNPPMIGPPGAGYDIQIGGERGLRFGASVGETAEAIGMIGGARVNGDMRAPSGYHYNKTGYFVKGNARSPAPYTNIGPAYVPPGTRLVRNRRRNPANPRAADRAMGRLQSAKRFAKKMGRVTIRSPKCACK